MKTFRIYLFLSVILLICQQSQAQKSFVIIPKKSGKVNKSLVASLPQSLKALAAFYGAMGGTNCVELNCELTTALGLGSQGSEEQKKIIRKYFPGDKAAELVLGQDCYLPPSGSSSFSNFQSLTFSVNGEIITVNYQLVIFEHGNSRIINGPDTYIFRNQVYKNKKRVLYAWTRK